MLLALQQQSSALPAHAATTNMHIWEWSALTLTNTSTKQSSSWVLLYTTPAHKQPPSKVHWEWL